MYSPYRWISLYISRCLFRYKKDTKICRFTLYDKNICILYRFLKSDCDKYENFTDSGNVLKLTYFCYYITPRLGYETVIALQLYLMEYYQFHCKYKNYSITIMFSLCWDFFPSMYVWQFCYQ